MVILIFCPSLALYALGEQYIRMIPDERERIIDAGTTLTLTCVYAFENEHEKDYNFSWLIPDYLAKNVEVHKIIFNPNRRSNFHPFSIS
jgi:hypothetical protein